MNVADGNNGQVLQFYTFDIYIYMYTTYVLLLALKIFILANIFKNISVRVKKCCTYVDYLIMALLIPPFLNLLDVDATSLHKILAHNG